MPMMKETMLKRLLLPIAAAGGGGSAPVQDTATGNPLVFFTDLARPLKSLLIPFTPIQSGTGNPSPENICPILPWHGLTVLSFAENLLNINSTRKTEAGMSYTTVEKGGKRVTVRVIGETTDNNSFFNLNYVSSETLSIPPGNYKVYGYTEKVGFRVYYIDANGTQINALTTDVPKPVNTFTIPTDAKCSWMRLQAAPNVQIDELIYPILIPADDSITETDIVFPSPVYGGTLDVVSGVLTVEWAGFTATWGDGEFATDMGSGITRKSYSMVDYLTTGLANNMCNIAPYQASENATVHFYYSGNGATNRNCRLFLPSDTPDSAEITVITKLSQPYEVQLTPEQISALLGDNTIWSDANGEMTATYLKKAE